MSRRLLVVSHPAVLAVNQLPYVALREHGWDPVVVVPAIWRHEYSAAAFAPETLPELHGRVLRRRVVLAGRVQRHLYLTSARQLVAELRPHVAFLEQEPTSVAAVQWSRQLERARIPFGMQAAENLDRPLPLPARVFRRYTLARAAFVAARSPTAGALVHRIRPDLPAPVIPHHVPSWPTVEVEPRRGAFVVGYAGRLVPEKGLDVLVDATAGLDDVVVRLIGNGPLRQELRVLAARRGVQLEIDSTVAHEQMATAYAGIDVLVLPSRTTKTWVEQFGRVLVEAMACGIPVLGSDSGEIPWVMSVTGGGMVFAEGDADALRAALVRLRAQPQLRLELAARGREQALRQFSVEAVAERLDAALRAAAAGRFDPALERDAAINSLAASGR
jgi:glycosyltransferase involved in cell wall biosynthesis